MLKLKKMHKNTETADYTPLQKKKIAQATCKVYFPSQHRSIDRVKRNAAKPSDVLRLLKQPVGLSRLAVRAADYMDNAVKLIKGRLERRQKRSINATGVFPKQVPENVRCHNLKLKFLPSFIRSNLFGGSAVHL